MHVKINKEIGKEYNETEWEELKIDGKPINFLQNPLIKGFKGKQKVKPITNKKYWRLEFFGNTAFKTNIFVTFFPTKPEDKNAIARAIWQDLDQNQEPNEEHYKNASQWLRDSNSLKQKDYEERSNRYICIDGMGISMIGKTFEKKTFERAIILLSLAVAYRIQIEKLMNMLSDCQPNKKELENLVHNALLFNAQCYFRHPVKMENSELPLIWDAIIDRLRIENFNKELIEQTQVLYRIISDMERDKENKRWQWIGFALGLISALQILTLFSEETRSNWWHTFYNLLMG